MKSKYHVTFIAAVVAGICLTIRAEEPSVPRQKQENTGRGLKGFFQSAIKPCNCPTCQKAAQRTEAKKRGLIANRPSATKAPSTPPANSTPKLAPSASTPSEPTEIPILSESTSVTSVENVRPTDVEELVEWVDLPKSTDMTSDATSPEHITADFRQEGSKLEHAYIAPALGEGLSDSEPRRCEEFCGPQSPSLQISWAGASAVNVGDETDCEIIIRNTGRTVAHEVVVHAVIPAAVRFVASRPAPASTGELIAWKLGAIESGREQRIQLKVIPKDKGSITAAASVTFSSLAYAQIKIDEPKLDLLIEAPGQVLTGDAMAFTLIVSNPGSSPVPGVIVSCVLPDGLAHPNGHEIEYEIGTLAAGESRAVQVSVAAVEPGDNVIQALAVSGAKLKSPAETPVRVVQPELALKVTGPSLRYLDREATYTLTAFNEGTASANNVRLAAIIPAGFQFVKAAEGGKHDWTNRSVSWFLGQLEPGGSRDVQLKLLASDSGPQVLQAHVVAERGLKASAQATTQVEGISALLLEVVDLDDPVEVGAETTYEIRVANQGSKPATNIEIIAEVPAELKPLDYKGPAPARIEGNQVTFERLPRLAPRADVVYRVKVRGIQAGDLRFRAKMTSDMLQSPVIEEESTRVYKD